VAYLEGMVMDTKLYESFWMILVVLTSILVGRCESQERHFRLTPDGERASYLSGIRFRADLLGKERTFVMDTGAAIHVFDFRYESGVERLLHFAEVEAGGNQLELPIFQSAKLHSNGIEIVLKEVALTDLTPLRNSFGFDIAGIVGAPFVVRNGLGYNHFSRFFFHSNRYQVSIRRFSS
jgi:hypothetical protein